MRPSEPTPPPASGVLPLPAHPSLGASVVLWPGSEADKTTTTTTTTNRDNGLGAKPASRDTNTLATAVETVSHCAHGAPSLGPGLDTTRDTDTNTNTTTTTTTTAVGPAPAPTPAPAPAPVPVRDYEVGDTMVDGDGMAWRVRSIDGAAGETVTWQEVRPKAEPGSTKPAGAAPASTTVKLEPDELSGARGPEPGAAGQRLPGAAAAPYHPATDAPGEVDPSAGGFGIERVVRSKVHGKATKGSKRKQPALLTLSHQPPCKLREPHAHASAFLLRGAGCGGEGAYLWLGSTRALWCALCTLRP